MRSVFVYFTWCINGAFFFSWLSFLNSNPFFVLIVSCLQVRDSEGNEVQFRIKKKTQLKKLMDAYCGRMGTSVGSTLRVVVAPCG